jgi:hypothetical protein
VLFDLESRVAVDGFPPVLGRDGPVIPAHLA